MDATAVAMTNGLKYKTLTKKKAILIALIFSIFQGIMPIIGYLFGFCALKSLLAYTGLISFIILCFLGFKSILNCLNEQKDLMANDAYLTLKAIIIQAIATSIDALTIGITLINYNVFQAFICCIIISIITFILALLGVFIGKKFGTLMKAYAELFGGFILIIIGITNIIK